MIFKFVDGRLWRWSDLGTEGSISVAEEKRGKLTLREQLTFSAGARCSMLDYSRLSEDQSCCLKVRRNRRGTTVG